MAHESLKLLERAAPRREATVRLIGEELFATLALRMPSGLLAPSVHVLATIEGGHVEVREQPTRRRYPEACYDRHIMPDGKFCLAYHADIDIGVISAENAAGWWAALVKFVLLQEAAEVTDEWPAAQEIDHGRGGAGLQMRSEVAAAAIGPTVAGIVRNKDFRVAETTHGKRTHLTLFIDGGIAMRCEDGGRLLGIDRPCLCGSGQPLVTCGSHAKAAKELLALLAARERFRLGFFKMAAEDGQRCCGRLRRCGLRNVEGKATYTIA